MSVIENTSTEALRPFDTDFEPDPRARLGAAAVIAAVSGTAALLTGVLGVVTLSH